MATKKTNKQKQYVDNNPIEAVRGSSGIAQSILSEVDQTTTALWDQLLGVGSYESNSSPEQSGELVQGEEINLSQPRKRKQEKEQSENIAPAYDYRSEILKVESHRNQEDMRLLEAQIQEIIVELKRLASSSKVMQAEFKEVAVDQRIVKPGKYHLSFFQWVLSVVRAARIRIEDSGSWLALFKSKKKDKQYWNMFKKHGTTFGLSNERVVATQTG